MAKDDYFVIVGKILGFLYLRLKHKTKKGIEYLQPMTKDFPIMQDYFEYVIRNLQNAGYIDGVTIIRAWGGDVIMMDVTEGIHITPKGIEYLKDNGTIHKILEKLPEFSGLASLFTI